MRLKFLHGLDDDMREQALQAFWQKNKNFVFFGFAALFLGYGATEFYQGHRAEVREQEALAFHIALGEDSANAYEALSMEASGGFKTLALFKVAEKSLAATDKKAALEAYEAIYGMKGLSPLWRDLAGLLEAELLIENAPEKAEEILKSLISNVSPYKANAYEILAILAQNQQNYEAAQGYYEYILSAPTTTPQHRAQIQDRLTYLEGQGFITLQNTVAE